MHISEYIVLDLETTGLSAEQGDKIIEIAAIKVRAGEIVDTFVTLVNPEIPLKPVVTAITGIEEESLRDAPVFSEVRGDLEAFVEQLPIVGHNIGFDIGFLRVLGLDLSNHAAVDTFVLATMFLPLQESYALEVLSHALGLTQGTHRALDDVRACYDLLEYICLQLQQMDTMVRGAIATVLRRAHHPYAHYFTDDVLSSQELISYVTSYSPGFTHTLYCPLPTLCLSPPVVHTSGARVLAYPLGSDYVLDALCVGQETANGQLILFQNETKLQGCLQKYSAPRDLPALTVVVRRPKTSFLSLERVTSLLQKDLYTSAEGALYAKLFTAMGLGSFDGTVHSLKLIHEEYGLWDILALTQDEESHWWDLFEHALEQAPLQFATHYGWCKEDERAHDLTVRILQAQHFPKSISYAARTELALKDLLALVGHIRMLGHWNTAWTSEDTESLEALADIIWGTLGMWFTEIGSAHQDYNVVPLLPHLQEHYRFVQLGEGLQKFCSKLRTFVEGMGENGNVFLPALLRHVTALETVVASLLDQRSSLVRQVAVLGDQGFSFVLFRTDVHEKIIAWTKEQAVYCYTYGGDVTPTREGDVQKFFPTLFRDPFVASFPVHLETETIKPLVIVPTDLPDPNNPLFFRESAKLLISIFSHFGGRVLGSFASRHALERIFQYVYPLMKKEGIHVLVEGLGGSLGKLFYKYRAEEEHSVLLGTNMLLEKIDVSASPLRALIIQKLPFGVVPQGLELSNKEKGFMEYGFPAMLMQLRGILNAGLQYPHERPVLFLLDNRLYSAGYGRDVERLLSEDMTVVQAPMKDIPKLLETYGG